MKTIFRTFCLLLVTSFCLAYESGFDRIKAEDPKNILEASRYYEIADVELNLVYRQVIQAFQNKIQSSNQGDYYAELILRLRQNQKDWLRFRKTSCELIAMHEGDTDAVLFFETRCLFHVTSERVIDLHRYHIVTTVNQ